MEIVNTFLCSVCPMLSMHTVIVSDCIISYGICEVAVLGWGYIGIIPSVFKLAPSFALPRPQR